MKARILVVDDDHVFRVTTSALLRDDGYDVVAVADGQQGVEALRCYAFDLMILDLRMPGTNGLGVLEALRRWGEDVPILMISGFGTIADAVQALHTGADDFLTKPVDPSVLSDRVAQLLERRPKAVIAGNDASGLVGRSPAMHSVVEAIQLVAPTNTTVLITGETGTGKELVARAIHHASPRSSGPFMAINCAALAESLLESELFGHVRGAFTGAVRDHAGLFQAAHAGTILLDEIGDVSSGMQHRLLRVLQERELLPVGGTNTVKVDVRVIATTNRDLRADVATGRFREDLYYRLKVFHIELPPLRARRGDVPLIVKHWLDTRGGGVGCSPFAMRLLQVYPWPGNVRELLGVLESARIRAGGLRIEAQYLPAEIRHFSGIAVDERDHAPRAAPADEAAAIRAALDQAGGVRARAAELLGVGRTTLWRRMKELGIKELN